MNELPPPSARAVRRARVALDIVTVVAGVAAAFALSRHLTPALVILAIVVVVAATASVVLMREISR